MSGIIPERLMTPARLTSTLTVPENQQAEEANRGVITDVRDHLPGPSRIRDPSGIR